MPTSRTLTTTTLAAALAAAVVPLTSPALAAPARSAQHPPTFVVECAGLGPVAMHEATGAAAFVADSPQPGVALVVVSARIDFYAGTEPTGEVVHTIERQWGARAGMSRLTCTRVATELDDGEAVTVSEVFVLGVVPRP